MKYRVTFLPGVREHDIPNAPRAYQEALVMNLRELTQGGSRGRPLQGQPGQEILEGYRKLYINPPVREQRMQRNLDKSKDPSEGMQGGGYRLVYREMRVRGEPTLLVAAFGPRKHSEAYDSAAQRILKQQEEQRLGQATQAAALPRQALRNLPRSAPAPGGPPTSGPGAKPRHTPRP